MKRFWKNACRGYMMIVETVNVCWAYLFRCEWRHSTRYTMNAIIILAALIPMTPFAYLFVAPIVAVIEGMREEGE